MVDVINKSVTANDAVHLTNPENGAVINLMIPTSWLPQVASLPTDLPSYWGTTRDIVLGATVLHEAMWGAAVDIAITKVASKSWEIRSDIALRTRKAQALLLFADGIVINDNGKMRMKSIGPNVGWVQFLSKHLRNFLCADNGSFVEIIREKKAIGSKIIGLRHLSSSRCIRTGDPEIPVLYRDKMSRVHELRDYQVMTFVDMPDPDETWNGTGLCAAARSYPAIYKLMSIERYVIEKVTGLKPLAIYVVNGLVQQQLDGAIKAAKEQQVGKGLASYMGAVIIGTPSDKAPEVATIPLAELPDRFDRKEELDLALLTYANNIGLDPQELQPLSGQGLGTGTQAQVLDDKASGKGLVAWQQQWTHQLNERVLDDDTTFIFIERDYRDMKARSEVTNSRATGMKTMIDSAIVTPEQAAQIMADLNEIPKEFVPEDLIAGDILSDVEKPDSRSSMNKKPDENLPEETNTSEGDTGNEAQTQTASEDIPQAGEGEEIIPDSEYNANPTPVESTQKKKKSFEDTIQFKERDPLDILKDVNNEKPWGNKPLAIIAKDAPMVGKAAIVKIVREKAKELGNDATFTAIHETTGLPYEDIFGAIRYLETYDTVRILDEGTRVKMYTPESVTEADDLLDEVEKKAKIKARKMLLAEKMTVKHVSKTDIRQ